MGNNNQRDLSQNSNSDSSRDRARNISRSPIGTTSSNNTNTSRGASGEDNTPTDSSLTDRVRVIRSSNPSSTSSTPSFGQGRMRIEIPAGRLGGGRATLSTLGEALLERIDQAQLEYALAVSRQDFERERKGPPPTDTSILDNLKEICLDLADIEEGNENCAICYEEQHCGDLAVKLPCFHAFHKKCVFPWLKQHNTCPVCRLELNKYFEEHQNAPLSSTSTSPSHLTTAATTTSNSEVLTENNVVEEVVDEQGSGDGRGRGNSTSDQSHRSNRSTSLERGEQQSGTSSEDILLRRAERRRKREIELEEQRRNLGIDQLEKEEMNRLLQQVVDGIESMNIGRDISNWSIKVLREFLKRVGFEEKMKNCVEKGDLVKLTEEVVQSIENGEVNEGEMRRRLKAIGVNDSFLNGKNGAVVIDLYRKAVAKLLS